MSSSMINDPDQYFSAEARRLQNASLSGLVGMFAGIPDVMSLSAGLPPPASFPLGGIHLDLENSDGPVSITEKSSVQAAQQYEFGPGHPQLLKWVKNTIQTAHNPPAACGFDCAITAGAVHALSLAGSLLCNPGDWMVMDEYSYSHAIEVVFVPKGIRPLPVRMDDHGMDPDHLRQQLTWANQQYAQWCAQVEGSSRPAGSPPWVDDGLPPPTGPPRVAYFIPTGHNPTGITLSLDRKKALYQVCSEFGLIILEDDAYWWLHWGDQPPSNQQKPMAPECNANQEPITAKAGSSPAADRGDDASSGSWYAQLPRSFLSLDVDGRVIRVDTLSKVLSPGFRVGWVTGHPTLIAKFALGSQATCVGSCPMAQVMVSQMLHSWGPGGWTAHLTRLQQMYRRKAAALEKAVAAHLTGLVRWRGVPGAGMFMWLEVLGKAGKPPEARKLAAALLDARVVVVPGSMSWSDLKAVKEGRDCQYLRLTFAYLEEEKLIEGVQRLAMALRRCIADDGR